MKQFFVRNVVNPLGPWIVVMRGEGPDCVVGKFATRREARSHRDHLKLQVAAGAHVVLRSTLAKA